jgi:hypothetical protein
VAHPDYEEFLAALNARRVRYLLGGAHALALHARPRATKDLDVFIAPTRANATRAAAAIRDFFGGQSPRYTDADSLLAAGVIVQLGVAPVRIDIMSSFGAVRFVDAWRRRVPARFGRIEAHFLSLDDIITEKEYWAREQDVADLVVLRRAKASPKRRSAPPAGRGARAPSPRRAGGDR